MKTYWAYILVLISAIFIIILKDRFIAFVPAIALGFAISTAIHNYLSANMRDKISQLERKLASDTAASIENIEDVVMILPLIDQIVSKYKDNGTNQAGYDDVGKVMIHLRTIADAMRYSSLLEDVKSTDAERDAALMWFAANTTPEDIPFIQDLKRYRWTAGHRVLIENAISQAHLNQSRKCPKQYSLPLPRCERL